MLEKRLEDKVEKWLTIKGFNVLENSIKYRQVVKDKQLPRGATKPMHIVVFQCWVVKDESTELCCIYVDVATEKVALLVTPHVSKWIEV
jgi:hypothetical protein